jgi:hypothetical protein
MAEFESYRSFQDFSHSITREWRFTRSAKQAEFLSTLLATSHSRREQISDGTTLWRAQIGDEWLPETGEENPHPFPPERMKPLRHRASEGRANPKGLPYLYAATDRETAIAEVRPWVGAAISVAQLRVMRPLRVVNCVSDERRLLLFGAEPNAAERERAVWRDVDEAFSRPITQDEQLADYVPTQVIAEAFRYDGVDGLAYRSSLGKGHNIVLFDLKAVDVMVCGLFQIQSVAFTSIETSNPYFTNLSPDAAKT